jgi:UDP-N-acetylmuramoylalanine--D-glutamate ligase
VPVEQVTTLAEAVEAARKLAPRGGTVLLSPGTSSFDQFSGYEQRGDVFRELVLNLR